MKSITQIAAIARVEKHRKQLAEAVRATGIREIARRVGVTPMRVSRFADGSSTHDVVMFYRIAAAVGCTLTLR
jgi:transcriptional regulator with XRE-family HTH domain